MNNPNLLLLYIVLPYAGYNCWKQLTNLPLDKWPPFWQTIISDAFFYTNFIEIYFQVSNWQQNSIGLGNGLAPNGREAITATNADPFHGRICAALGRGEFKVKTIATELWLRDISMQLIMRIW